MRDASRISEVDLCMGWVWKLDVLGSRALSRRKRSLGILFSNLGEIREVCIRGELVSGTRRRLFPDAAGTWACMRWPSKEFSSAPCRRGALPGGSHQQCTLVGAQAEEEAELTAREAGPGAL